jgi:hypothetical protein
MFVVEYDEDLKLLTESICKDVPFDCVSIAQVSEERLLPPSDLESLRCFGLYDVVTNIFDAPREIKLAMCSHTPYSWIYVGNKTCEEHTEEICEKTNVRHWYVVVSFGLFTVLCVYCLGLIPRNIFELRSHDLRRKRYCNASPCGQ